jgi:hypothetical protein
MGFTDKFRQQHEEILGIAGELQKMMKTKADPQDLRTVLSSLAGKLNFHLAMEDKALYPRVMKIDAAAHAVATRFVEEMGGLAEQFAAFNNKWQVSAIRSDPDGFANQAHKIFNALGKRVARENAELYPLADKAA